MTAMAEYFDVRVIRCARFNLEVQRMRKQLRVEF